METDICMLGECVLAVCSMANISLQQVMLRAPVTGAMFASAQTHQALLTILKTKLQGPYPMPKTDIPVELEVNGTH